MHSRLGQAKVFHRWQSKSVGLLCDHERNAICNSKMTHELPRI